MLVFTISLHSPQIPAIKPRKVDFGRLIGSLFKGKTAQQSDNPVLLVQQDFFKVNGSQPDNALFKVLYELYKFRNFTLALYKMVNSTSIRSQNKRENRKGVFSVSLRGRGYRNGVKRTAKEPDGYWSRAGKEQPPR